MTVPDTAAKPPGEDADPPPAARSFLPASILVVFAAIVGLGATCLYVSGPHASPSEVAYRSLGLLAHDSDWAFGKNAGTDSLLFRLLAIVAPLFVATSAIYLITDRLRPALLQLRALYLLHARHRRAVALIGLTDSSLAAARALSRSTAQSGEKPVTYLPLIFTDTRTGRLAVSCRHAGIATFRRRRPAPGQPPRGLIRHAPHIISFLPDAASQLDFLAELQDWPSHPPTTTRAVLLLEDRGLSQRLDQLHRLRGPLRLRLLTRHMLAARQLLLSHQFDVLADAFGQEQIHLVVFGLGQAGRAIVKEAAQLYVTRPALATPPPLLRITIIDQRGEAAIAALHAEDPGIGQVITLSVHAAHIASGGLLADQVALLPPDATAHIVAFDDPAHCFNLALSLRRWLLEPPAPAADAADTHAADAADTHAAARAGTHAAPIFVRLTSRAGIGRLFDTPRPEASKPAGSPSRAGAPQPRPTPPPDGLSDFGALEAIFGPAGALPRPGQVLDEASENGAAAIHQAYLDRRTAVPYSGGPAAARTAQESWQTLSPQMRESNVRAYDHLAIKARAAGCRLVTGRAVAPPDISALHAHAADLCRLEHARYKAERLANGWRYAAHRLDAVAVHPDLVAWESLDPHERTLDAAQVEAMPKVAHAAGQHLATALVIGIIGALPSGPATAQPGARTIDPSTAPALAQPDYTPHLTELLRAYPGTAPLVLTALTPGAGCDAAIQAASLGIPVRAILPLPYEIMREDFPPPAEPVTAAPPHDLATFHRLAAAAEQRIDLPMRFSRASAMTRNPQPPDPANLDRRRRQYELAHAYIVSRANILILAPGAPPEAAAWWAHGVPDDYAFPSRFFPEPVRRLHPIEL